MDSAHGRTACHEAGAEKQEHNQACGAARHPSIPVVVAAWGAMPLRNREACVRWLNGRTPMLYRLIVP